MSNALKYKKHDEPPMITVSWEIIPFTKLMKALI